MLLVLNLYLFTVNVTVCTFSVLAFYEMQTQAYLQQLAFLLYHNHVNMLRMSDYFPNSRCNFLRQYYNTYNSELYISRRLRAVYIRER